MRHVSGASIDDCQQRRSCLHHVWCNEQQQNRLVRHVSSARLVVHWPPKYELPFLFCNRVSEYLHVLYLNSCCDNSLKGLSGKVFCQSLVWGFMRISHASVDFFVFLCVRNLNYVTKLRTLNGVPKNRNFFSWQRFYSRIHKYWLHTCDKFCFVQKVSVSVHTCTRTISKPLALAKRLQRGDISSGYFP